MKLTARPYQEDAIEAVIAHVKKRLSPCVIELPTGSGKAFVVSKLAGFFQSVAPKKKVLCIAPNRELVEQNHETYTVEYEYPASIYCASAGIKCMRHQVIFCSPQSALKQIDKIAHMGVSAIIIDECQMITESVKKLIKSVLEYEIYDKKINEKCRIIGTTATPYRMGTGYIYAIDATGEEDIHLDETKAVDPYFTKLVYRIGTGELIADKYLSDLVVGDVASNYDTSDLKMNSMGKFTPQSMEKVFAGNTKTERIVNEVLEKSQDKMGVMFFASTINHAEEILGYLPPDSKLVTGKLKKKERAQIVSAYKNREFKYIVNVDVLTVGVNFPHVDMIAVLRATESAGLFQQIVGRELRLHPEKEHAVLLDYAENIERHGLQSDVFSPEIKARKKTGEGVEIEVVCPACGAHSVKKKRNEMTYAGLAHDAFGNFLISGTEKAIAWEDGVPVLWEGETLTMQVLDPTTMDEFGDCGFKEIPVPAHYSRRCSNPEAYVLSGKPIRCEHRYSAKVCPDCHADNDIAARHCVECKVRLVDPNEKLTEKAGQAGIIAMGETRTVHCLSAKYEPYVGGGGKHSIKATYNTEIGAIVAWHTSRQHWIFNRLAEANGIVRSKIDDAIDAKYSQCAFWTVAPHQIKVKKSEGQNGYAKFEVKQVEFLEEQVG
ncbi:helicase superfamily 1/2 ATP-binding domain protein [Vibrio phage 1.191.O._10N.286.52.B4]|nr:helicase superfamily 1/2 ATP-binding domain protein [Vibrio phage 1.191.O._10N.286.52.B4]